MKNLIILKIKISLSNYINIKSCRRALNNLNLYSHFLQLRPTEGESFYEVNMSQMIDCTKENNVWIKPLYFDDRYWITTTGQIWSRINNMWLTLKPHKDGYVYVKISRNNYKVHSLVYKTFVRQYDGNVEQCHHKNHNRSDNRLENLKVMNGSEHLSEHFSGENNPMYGRKHTEEEKRIISEANKGKKISQQTIQKRLATRELRKQQNPDRYKMSASARQKQREAKLRNPSKKDSLTGKFINFNK